MYPKMSKPRIMTVMPLKLSHHPFQWLVLTILDVALLPINLSISCRSIFNSCSLCRSFAEDLGNQAKLLHLADRLSIIGQNVVDQLSNYFGLVKLLDLPINLQIVCRTPAFSLGSLKLKSVQVGCKSRLKEFSELNHQNLKFNRNIKCH